MDMQEMKDIAIQSSKLGVEVIVLTGGEPTLIKHEDLCLYFQFVKQETSIKIVRIVTNGHWAKTYDKAYSILKDWKDAGLDELNVSCGEFHQEFVPIQNIANAYNAGCDLEYMTVLLAGEFTKSKTKDKITPYDFENIIGCRIIQHNEVSPFVSKKYAMTCNNAVPYGRGCLYIKAEDIPAEKYENMQNTCRSTISTLALHPDGYVTICCGVGAKDVPFLTIGNWKKESLADILDRSNDDLIANIIRFYGLKSLKEKLMTVCNLKYQHQYIGICELCFELFTNKDVANYINNYGLELENDIIAKKIIYKSTIYSSKYSYQ
jgi:MoaA/NifB/PqqE/SkfB family radical SAM enzyme